MFLYWLIMFTSSFPLSFEPHDENNNAVSQDDFIKISLTEMLACSTNAHLLGCRKAPVQLISHSKNKKYFQVPFWCFSLSQIVDLCKYLEGLFSTWKHHNIGTSFVLLDLGISIIVFPVTDLWY